MREGEEATFPATESTRTRRDLAPDASFAAQASGFFYVPPRPLDGKRNFSAVEHEFEYLTKPVRPVAMIHVHSRLKR